MKTFWRLSVSAVCGAAIKDVQLETGLEACSFLQTEMKLKNQKTENTPECRSLADLYCVCGKFGPWGPGIGECKIGSVCSNKTVEKELSMDQGRPKWQQQESIILHFWNEVVNNLCPYCALSSLMGESTHRLCPCCALPY